MMNALIPIQTHLAALEFSFPKVFHADDAIDCGSGASNF
jgi:hypothetical protein